MLTAVPHPESKGKWVVVDDAGVIRHGMRTFTNEVKAKAVAAHSAMTQKQLLDVVADLTTALDQIAKVTGTSTEANMIARLALGSS